MPQDVTATTKNSATAGSGWEGIGQTLDMGTRTRPRADTPEKRCSTVIDRPVSLSGRRFVQPAFRGADQPVNVGVAVTATTTAGGAVVGGATVVVVVVVGGTTGPACHAGLKLSPSAVVVTRVCPLPSAPIT